MSQRTSFSPFKTGLGVAAVAFVGLAAFMFSFGYVDLDNRSDASSRGCQNTGGYAERNSRTRVATGRCVCPNGQVVTPPKTCITPRSDSAAAQFQRTATPSAIPKATAVPRGVQEKPSQPVIVPVYQ